jgi:hypothetical protein
MAKYSALAQKDNERYAEETAAFDCEDGVAPQAVKKKTATPGKRAASFEDAAQPPSAHDVVRPDWASLSAAAASVYSYAVGYLQPFLVVVHGTRFDPKMARSQRTRWSALQLMAAGSGPLRAPTCNHTLRVASGETAPGQALLRRALSLVGPGELQELREARTSCVREGTCDFIQSMLEHEPLGPHGKRDGAPYDAPVSRALASLRVIEGKDVPLPVAIVQQCAATLTELECYRLSCGAVLPLCTRLQSLTLSDWNGCPPVAWLGLSQLHTLRGVSLPDIPAAAIAAALPRLHTLHLDHRFIAVEFPVAMFYDELLPRLRSFHLEGRWLETNDEMEEVNVPLLPLLEDLKWWSWTAKLPRQLMAARPSTLAISDVDLVEWLKVADGAGPESSPVTRPLVRLRALTLRLARRSPMARLPRAVPHLWQLTLHVYEFEHARHVLSEEPAFTGVIHPTLRRVAITTIHSSADLLVPDDYGVRLRQRHFPRLRRFTVKDEEYPVWVPRRARRRKRF